MHPLAGRPILWHVLGVYGEVSPRAEHAVVVHREESALMVPEGPGIATTLIGAAPGDEVATLRRVLAAQSFAVLADGAAPLIAARSVSRLLQAAQAGVAALTSCHEASAPVAVAGEGWALAERESPWRPGYTRVVGATEEELELVRVRDRASLATASAVLRDRLVRQHQRNGVTFLLPMTVWLDFDVQIGEDTVIYPGVVLEGRTEIGSECVIGPHCRVIEASIGRGVELKGWNYVARTSIRNHAVLEPYVRRGFE
jgi:bifunctional N-acetylglucosamine-1-phosphate-uridyltransferase/glucosamine-1-phosphate-acetyltransferase GlmU-like protein